MKWWRVEVMTHEGTLVAIEPEILAGKSDLTPEDVETIRECAAHLQGFAGSPIPQPCFLCGEVEPVECPACSGETR